MSKLTYFCPNCWVEVPPHAEKCPHCGFDLTAYEQLPFEDKLILSLRNPIEDSRIVAVQSLGKLGSRAAVPVFAEMIDTESSYYVLCEIIRALALIDHPRSHELLDRLTTHESRLVQRCAREAIDRLTKPAQTANPPSPIAGGEL